MNIKEISMKAFHFDKMKHFYTDVLQMELIMEEQNSFTVIAGKTRLQFERDVKQPFYHFCFRTNSIYFDIMYKRLEELNILLEDEEGETSLYSKGKQVYFTDPDGNILEILERPFYYDDEEPKGWFDICEIGFPSSSVGELQKVLTPIIKDLMNYDSESFAFYGEEEKGVFVLVKEGRHWYPTKRPATIHELTVTVSGDRDDKWVHPTLPYTIEVTQL